MLLLRNICVVVKSHVIENRVTKGTEFVARVWLHILVLVAEIATATTVYESRLDQNSIHLFTSRVRASSY